MLDVTTWQEIAFGWLGWTPEVFWSSTILELSNAYIGHCKRYELGRWANKGNGFTEASLEDFKRQMEAVKGKYPDGPLTKRGKKEHRRVRYTH